MILQRGYFLVNEASVMRCLSWPPALQHFFGIIILPSVGLARGREEEFMMCISQDVHNIIGKLHVCQKRCVMCVTLFFSSGNKNTSNNTRKKKNKLSI